MNSRISYKYQQVDHLDLNRNSGFTLIELIVAIAITGIVITLTGSGLLALMNANQRSQSETADRLELEQAVAFMTDEIKMSQKIEFSLSLPAAESSAFNEVSGSSNSKIILILKPASNSQLIDPIVYYLADPPSTSVWLGPKVIYRWGPTLLQNGNYSDGNGNDIAKILPTDKITYYNEVLVDQISDTASAEAKINCDSSYNYPLPSVAKRLGFYACIAPDRKSVKLWISKQKNSSGKSQSINALVMTRSN
jgi:prepilin-type N-terminal cleavage/methylation domain-containing protein